MKLKLCIEPNCRNMVIDAHSAFCPIHKAQRDKLKAMRTSYGSRTKSNQWHNLYNSTRWRKASKQFLAEHPLCVLCGRPAKITDHIIPHRGNLDLFWNESNWQPVCWSCHSKKTVREQKN